MEVQGHRVKNGGRSICGCLISTKYSNSRQLVNKDTNAKVAESQSRKRSSLFRKARDMSLEISDAVSLAVDVILLTFVLVWSERQNERSKSMTLVRVGGGDAITGIPLAPLPVDD